MAKIKKQYFTLKNTITLQIYVTTNQALYALKSQFVFFLIQNKIETLRIQKRVTVRHTV
jgi:hypothetical protein